MKVIRCNVEPGWSLFDLYLGDRMVYIACAISWPGRLRCDDGPPRPKRVTQNADAAAWLRRKVAELAQAERPLSVWVQYTEARRRAPELVPAGLITRVEEHRIGTVWCPTCEQVAPRCGYRCVGCQEAAS